MVDMKNKQVNADTDIVFISECSQIERILENPLALLTERIENEKTRIYWISHFQ